MTQPIQIPHALVIVTANVGPGPSQPIDIDTTLYTSP